MKPTRNFGASCAFKSSALILSSSVYQVARTSGGTAGPANGQGTHARTVVVVAIAVVVVVVAAAAAVVVVVVALACVLLALQYTQQQYGNCSFQLRCITKCVLSLSYRSKIPTRCACKLSMLHVVY